MKGTLINVLAILIGSALGILLKKGIPQRILDSLLKAEGLAILIIGLASTFAEMLRQNPETGSLTSNGGLALLISLVLGCLIGELLRIDDHLNNLGDLAEKRLKMEGFAKGFISASVVFSMGTMVFMGPITEALTGDPTVLYIKSVLDGTTSVVLASTMGAGVAFACIPVLIVQTTTSLLASQLEHLITPGLLSLFCMTGYTMVAAIGMNFLFPAKIKVANLLPALVVTILYYFFILA